MFAPSKRFQPSQLIEGKAGSLPLSGTPEKCFTWVGSCLTCKYYTILERLASDEHSCLLRKFITYGCKKFYKNCPVSGNTSRRGRLSTVDLLIKIACLATKVKDDFNMKMS